MTIADIANNHNISVRTVYRYINRSGIRVQDLRSDGELSQIGVTIIEHLLPTKPQQNICRKPTGALYDREILMKVYNNLAEIMDLLDDYLK